MILTAYKEGECPEVIHKRAGDESYDICKFTGRTCLIEHGLYECEIFNDYLAELKEELLEDK